MQGKVIHKIIHKQVFFSVFLWITSLRCALILPLFSDASSPQACIDAWG